MAATMALAPSGSGIGSSYPDEPSNGSSTPRASTSTCVPPYPPPSDVAYPETTIPNPHAKSMAHQPVFTNLPAGSLFRPARLPADMDARVDKSSVWMGLDKHTHSAVYFLPPICKGCTKTGAATHCDRGWPSCQRCSLRGADCELGTKWSQMRLKVKRKSEVGGTPRESLDAAPSQAQVKEEEEEGSRYSAAEKGKGRASIGASANSSPFSSKLEHPDLSPVSHINGNGNANANGFEHTMPIPTSTLLPQYPPAPPAPSSPSEGGRGKRTKKKRRLSRGEEIDPESIDDDGNLLPPKPTPPAAPPPSSQRYPSTTAHMTVESVTRPLQTSEDQPPVATPDDVKYLTRIDRNGRKAPLKNMRAACPAWSTTRRALQGGAEYLRDPSRIEGGSVEVGVGGVARGIILEGKSVGGGNFWGAKAAAGSIMVGLGSARDRRLSDSPVSASQNAAGAAGSDQPGPSIPRINILPSTIHIDSHGRTLPESSQVTEMTEEPEIEALLLAQRARTPLAIAVAQDYLEPPFKVPRAFVVLGWFWLTDAWLEPESMWHPGVPRSRRLLPSEITHVRWKFRFEWCRGNQGVPWWSPTDDPARPPTPYIEYKFIIEPLEISGPGVKGASTVIPVEKVGSSDQRTPCALCGCVSEAVYRDAKVCLNELCSGFFMPTGGGGLDPITNTPSPLRPLQRKTPEFLGLKLRGTDPFATNEEGLTRDQLGGDFWRGWVCGKCGMANERRRWSGWDCEGCKHQIFPARKPLTPERLHNPLHPGIISTGAPRTDTGHAAFPSSIKHTLGYTIYEHHVKVVKHSLQLKDKSDACAGTCTSEVYHALHARKEGVVDVASRVWREMQGEGGDERRGLGAVGMRRGMMGLLSRRPAERSLCPFYLIAMGPESLKRISGFPSAVDTIPWLSAPNACLDAMDLINFRAGCMFPGLAERFNSLIVAVMPPPCVPSPPITFMIQPGEYLAILAIGSEATIQLRPVPPSPPPSHDKETTEAGDAAQPVEITETAKTAEVFETGSMIMQHGDVLGLKADMGGMEITIRPDGFGIVCIAQQIYRGISEPGLGAFTQTTDRDPAPLPAPADSSVKVEEVGPIPAKSTVWTPAPLLDWYIGPRPLDINQPMRFRRPGRVRPIVPKLAMGAGMGGPAGPGAMKGKGKGKGKDKGKGKQKEGENVEETPLADGEEGGENSSQTAIDANPAPDAVMAVGEESKEVEVEFDVDPKHATGFIILDDLPIDTSDVNYEATNYAPPTSSRLLIPEIPPSPTGPTSVPGPRRRGPAKPRDGDTPDGGAKSSRRKSGVKRKEPEDGDGPDAAETESPAGVGRARGRARGGAGARGRGSRGGGRRRGGRRVSDVRDSPGGTSTSSPSKKRKGPGKGRKSAATLAAEEEEGGDGDGGEDGDQPEKLEVEEDGGAGDGNEDVEMADEGGNADGDVGDVGEEDGEGMIVAQVADVPEQ